MNELLQRFSKTVESMDPNTYAELFAEDGVLRIGNAAPAKGKNQIRDAAAAAYADVNAIKINVINSWEVGDAMFAQLEVTYDTKDGRQVTIPVANLFRVKDGKISELDLYLDPAPLYQKAA